MFYNIKSGAAWVSIHTPTKGVTLVDTLMIRIWLVSIHTPTKGVTLINKKHRPRRYVSIHTPTKGVTDRTTDTAS